MPAPSAPRPAGCPPLPVVRGLAAHCEEVWPSLLAVLTRLERCGMHWVARPGLTVGAPSEADGGPEVLQRLTVPLLSGSSPSHVSWWLYCSFEGGFDLVLFHCISG